MITCMTTQLLTRYYDKPTFQTEHNTYYRSIHVIIRVTFKINVYL